MRRGLLFFKRCTVLTLLFLCTCRGREPRTVQRSFFYWKTVFRLSKAEENVLRQLAVQTLYLKFFDVEWTAEAGAQPAAKSIIQQLPPARLFITPVVFLTQETLLHSTTTQLDTLAANMAGLLSAIATNNHLPLTGEVQLDCDWTSATRDRYFHLLETLKRQPFFRGKILSATIRLHQVKFRSQTGVPPADKGLLMCYNMGNLRSAQTKNSIIEEAELKKYTSHLETYPLPLDVALPVFDWYILFDGNRYKGLVRDFTPSNEDKEKDHILFTQDTLINGYRFHKGEWLRHEQSKAEVVAKCAEDIGRKLNRKKLVVILYHLHESSLAKYTLHELESFYDRLR